MVEDPPAGRIWDPRRSDGGGLARSIPLERRSMIPCQRIGRANYAAWISGSVVKMTLDKGVPAAYGWGVPGAGPGFFENPIRETKVNRRVEVSNLHKSWIETAVSKGLARFEDAEITVRNVPNKGDETKVPFKKVAFTIDNPEQASALAAIAEAGRGTTKDDDGNEHPAEHPLATLLTYAYGLNCRAKVRAEFESQYEDPDKALKKIAALLVKSGQFKDEAKALAAARAMREASDDDDDDA